MMLQAVRVSACVSAVGRRAMATRRTVNALWTPGIPAVPCPTVPTECSRDPCICNPDKLSATKDALLARHSASRAWAAEEIAAAHERHSLFTWTNHTAASQGAIQIARAEGVYFWDQSGKRYIDFNSMAMCTHHGFTPDQSIIDAIVQQLRTVPYAYPGLFVTETRARLCALLAELCPGDINTFMFPSSGAEANEVALRMARLKTGRHKVLSRYRSYHGATVATMSLTGDHRRWPAEMGGHGHLKFFDPFPYSFTRGASEEEITSRCLTELREMLLMEGTHTIAAIVMESVTGTNGILVPPKGYLQGVRALCDEFGIVMVCDEVMAGFGRTGKLFGFCHANGVIPDIITFAKGVNGAFLPLGGVGVRDHIAEHFRKNNVSIGSTYNSHPVALASAYAALQHFVKEDFVGKAEKMGKVLHSGLQELMDKHPSVKAARCVGLFSCLDIQKNTRGDFIARVSDPLPPAMQKFKKTLLDNGLFTMMRGHNVFANPPLIITEPQLKEGLAIMDKALNVLDEAMEK